MAISLMNTKDVLHSGVKILVHGNSGVGKTWLCRTLPNPIIISAESGLLTLKDCNLPYMEVKTILDLQEAFKWITESEEGKKFDSVALDSISEISEVVLSHEKSKTKDGRQAYGETNESVAKIIRAFRDIKGKHVYMSAKTEKATDERGRILYSPSLVGKTLSMQIPYWFDMVFALRVEQKEDGTKWRGLLTETDDIWTAKNRGGYLDTWEAPDLGKIIGKIK